MGAIGGDSGGLVGNNLGGGLAGGAIGNVLLGPAGMAIGALKGSNGSGSLGAFGPGGIGGAMGIQGGAAPEAATLTPGVSIGDVNNSAAGVRSTINQQQDLLNALQGQGGIGNQASTFNQSQGLANQLAGANGIGNMSSALSAQQHLAGQQQALADQYQSIANGSGPNPAQAMLNNATGQNVANQAAMMAGQRGAGANVGLMARQAGQMGANMQQQAVGQGAQMQAQQQLAALQGIAGQQQAIGSTNQNVANIGAQQLGAQQGQQQALAAQAATQVGQQMGATNALNQAQQAQQQTLLGALNSQNQNNVSMQSNINAANAGLSNTAMQGRQGLTGGVLNSAGAALGLAKGGMVRMADGGDPMGTTPTSSVPAPQSSFGKFVNNVQTNLANMDYGNYGANSLQSGMANFGKGIGKFIKNHSTSDPEEATSTGGFAQLPLEGPAAPGAVPQGQMGFMKPEGPEMASGGLADSGGKVAASSPDQKAVKAGNSYDNDKIPAMLSDGEFVLDREVMQSPDPAMAAYNKVKEHLAKGGKK